MEAAMIKTTTHLQERKGRHAESQHNACGRVVHPITIPFQKAGSSLIRPIQAKSL